MMQDSYLSIRHVGADEGSEVRLVLSGEMDVATVDDLKAAIAASADKRVVIDTTRLTFIDSLGLGVLVNVRNQLGPDRFVLIPGEVTERVLKLSGTAEHLLG